MTLTKRGLVLRIAEETQMTQQQVLEVLQRTLDHIGAALAQGNKVELRNFGVFEVKVRKARIGRNPNAPVANVPIPARSVVKFKPGKEMRAAVFKLPPVAPEKKPRRQALNRAAKAAAAAPPATPSPAPIATPPGTGTPPGK